jgi:hypothetical protein
MKPMGHAQKSHYDYDRLQKQLDGLFYKAGRDGADHDRLEIMFMEAGATTGHLWTPIDIETGQKQRLPQKTKRKLLEGFLDFLVKRAIVKDGMSPQEFIALAAKECTDRVRYENELRKEFGESPLPNDPLWSFVLEEHVTPQQEQEKAAKLAVERLMKRVRKRGPS